MIKNMDLLNDALVMPYQGTMDKFQGGVFTKEGHFLQDSIVYRGSKPIFEEPVDYLEGTYIWGGCIFVHFGHFIWETLSRLYCIRQCPAKYPLVFISPTCKLDYVKLLFKTLGIKNPLILLEKPTRIQRMLFSQPGSRIVPLEMMEHQVNALAYFNCKNQGMDKIWLSRTALQPWQHTDSGEAGVENKLQEYGFTIIHPESLSLREQVSLLSTANVVAGFDGSAWFSLFLAKHVRCKAFVFNRFEKIVDTVACLMQVKRIGHKLYELPIEHSDNAHGKPGSQGKKHREPERIVDILREAIRTSKEW